MIRFLVVALTLLMFVGKAFALTPVLATLSWWIVFSPLLVYAGIVLLAFLVVFVIAAIGAVVQ